MTSLLRLWDLLLQVRHLSFVARTAGRTGWNGRGRGTVEVELAQAAMTFREQGTWKPENSGRAIRFFNVYRWMLAGELLRLEHLRQGEHEPVRLFDLAPAGEQEWRPASPHVCGADCYSAVLLVREDDITLRWSVDGPRKRETIEYRYW